MMAIRERLKEEEKTKTKVQINNLEFEILKKKKKHIGKIIRFRPW